MLAIHAVIAATLFITPMIAADYAAAEPPADAADAIF